MQKLIHMRFLSAALGTLFLGALAIPALAAKTTPNTDVSEHFFIISSVDLGKNQLFLRHPTDVTTVMEVTSKTVCVDENGKTIPFSALHAGNTVYVTYSADPHGTPVATRIRKGPMTLQVLHQRYLKFK